MKDGVKYTGVPSEQELAQSPGVPGRERLDKGPVAYIECVQYIPCNPCEKACPFGAITVGDSITELPRLDEEKCTGCGSCIASCPGLAIFRVHKNYTETTSLIEFPYEYDPLPEEGEIVPCGDREGRYVADGVVRKVKNPRANDNTPTITVEAPKAFCNTIRTICRKRG